MAANTAEGGPSNDTCCMTAFFDGCSVESSRYFHSRRTVLEMLLDRGYAVPDSELTRSLAEFRSLFGQLPNPESLRICVSLSSDPSKKVLVLFMGTDDIKKQTIDGIRNQIQDVGRLNGLILIVQSKMTAYARKDLLQNFPIKVEIIEINDLLVNITKHMLQPKYELLSADEKQALLMKYKLEDKQLPYMLKTDAIARYYGLERGQVIKITHKGDLLDSVVTYRCVM